jgi:hypothetical protein
MQQDQHLARVAVHKRVRVSRTSDAMWALFSTVVPVLHTAVHTHVPEFSTGSSTMGIITPV